MAFTHKVERLHDLDDQTVSEYWRLGYPHETVEPDILFGMIGMGIFWYFR